MRTRARGGGCATALLTLLTLAFCGWAALSLAALDSDRYTVALAALIQEKERMRGKKVAVILSGGNGDMSQMAQILGGETPRVTTDMRKAI